LFSDDFRRFSNKFSDYGYKYIQTPLLEYKELFDKSIGESSEIVTKQMYELKDKGGRDLVLRPEGTSSVVRYHAEFNKDNTSKYSYFGSMFRYENPQKNRYREFNQAGAEIVGLIDIYSDFQIINDSLNFINNLLPGTALKINTIGSIEDREAYVNVLYEYFSKNKEKLSKESLEKIENNTLRILDSNNSEDREIINNAPTINEYINSDSKENFESLLRLLDNSQINYEIDYSLVRGLDYYTRTTFEIKSTELGSQDALCGGGRYDKLLELVGGDPLPAVGFGMGDVVVGELLRIRKLYSPKSDKIDLYLVIVGEEQRSLALRIAHNQREKGRNVLYGFRPENMGKQLEIASKSGASQVVILAPDELKKNLVVLKNMETGEQSEMALEELTT
jgi:histidyl-tRNA synthetase